MNLTYDIAVIGAGIAGASVAAHLAHAGKRVTLLEMESQPGYHTTGRSAAIYVPSYGPAPIRALTIASGTFFNATPNEFSPTPILSPRQVLMIARTDQQDALNALFADVADQPGIHKLDQAALEQLNPLIRKGYAQTGMLDETAQDIDVGALHQGYLRMFGAAGGEVLNRHEVMGLSRIGGHWQIETPKGSVRAGTIVNAAGAWADQIGALAGVEHIGLIPKRRTAALISCPSGMDLTNVPMAADIGGEFYLKPDAGRLLISPSDETPSAPCDAQPEELDLAICADRIETAFNLKVHRFENTWAGLRSSVFDDCPVAGFSDQAEGFYWLAGQSGYGIQIAPALSEFAAAQILGHDIPNDIIATGLTPAHLSPQRIAAQG